MSNRITFRADASLSMGSGHVMRCLTLAERLREKGAECRFICREHPGHLLQTIRSRGFEVIGLPIGEQKQVVDVHAPPHAAWLGSSWEADVAQTKAALATSDSAWLVVDHYALDARWEAAMRSTSRHLMVIDDLADRPHQCDLLLDQNLGRRSSDYAGLVSLSCRVLAGSRFALLRPDFAALRDISLLRRADSQLKHLLVTLGGVDQPNATSRVLDALRHCVLDKDTHITVVMGASAPWLAAVSELAEHMPWPTEVLVNIQDMAERMVASDLAIGAAGGTAWERCSLGLPTLMVVLAENQRQGALALERAGAAALIGEVDEIASRLPGNLEVLRRARALTAMSQAAAAVTSGTGAALVVREMETINE